MPWVWGVTPSVTTVAASDSVTAVLAAGTDVEAFLLQDDAAKIMHTPNKTIRAFLKDVKAFVVFIIFDFDFV